MNEQENSLIKQITKWVVNDYFTPNIRAEVVIDTLLTPYVRQILQNECGIIAKFLTKEMSMEEYVEEDPQSEEYAGDKRKTKDDDYGAKIDYLLASEQYVYLVELKTTAGSIKAEQAKRYLDCYCNQEKPIKPMKFGEVFGEKLLRILRKKYKDDRLQSLDTLEESFLNIVNDRREKIPYAEKAKEYLKCNNKASTYKYLYTIGQILDCCPDSTCLKEFLKELWGKELRLIYITPNGELLPNELSECAPFYIRPEHLGSICLKTAVSNLKPEDGGEEYLQTLQAIVREI